MFVNFIPETKEKHWFKIIHPWTYLSELMCKRSNLILTPNILKNRKWSSYWTIPISAPEPPYSITIISFRRHERLRWFRKSRVVYTLTTLLDTPVVKVHTIRDLGNHLSLSCLQKLMVCNRRRCLMCINRNDPIRGPFGVFEDIRREDEIRSLAH